MIEVKVDQNAINEAEKLLEHIPGGIYRATARAAKRSLTTGRKVASSQVRSVYTVKAGDVKGTFAMKLQEGANFIEGELSSKGGKLSLQRFKHTRANDTTGANRRQISVEVKKGNNRPFATGFISAKKGGNIFIRRHGVNLQRPRSVAVPQMLANTLVHPEIENSMAEMFNKRFDHEVNQLLKKGK